MRSSWCFVLALAIAPSAWAKDKKPMTIQEALADAEQALDTGRLGDAIDESEKLKRSKHLTKEEQARLEVVSGRCALILGKFDESTKLLGKRYKAAPDDTRLAEWYARALGGAGKSDEALTLLSSLAKDDKLQEGDSYWALAQLERDKGETEAARAHAKLALEKPIVLQSDALDQEIHKFIEQLTPQSKSK